LLARGLRQHPRNWRRGSTVLRLNVPNHRSPATRVTGAGMDWFTSSQFAANCLMYACAFLPSSAGLMPKVSEIFGASPR